MNGEDFGFMKKKVKFILIVICAGCSRNGHYVDFI